MTGDGTGYCATGGPGSATGAGTVQTADRPFTRNPVPPAQAGLTRVGCRHNFAFSNPYTLNQIK